MVGLTETTEMLPKLPIHRVLSVVLEVIKTWQNGGTWETCNLLDSWLVKIISLFLFLNKYTVAQENKIIYYDEWYHWLDLKAYTSTTSGYCKVMIIFKYSVYLVHHLCTFLLFSVLFRCHVGSDVCSLAEIYKGSP